MSDQQVIEGVKPPPAPKRSQEMVQAAVEAYIKRHDFDWGDPDQSAFEISRHWSPGIDGYELAKLLDDYEGWAITVDDVNELDCISSVVWQAEEDARKEWAAKWNIQPPLPIGTKLKQGEVVGVSEHRAACYNVKEVGCTREGRYLIVKFEDAALMPRSEK